MIVDHTKYGRLLVGAQVVIGEVKEHAQFVRENREESLMILGPDQPV